jgi:transposase
MPIVIRPAIKYNCRTKERNRVERFLNRAKHYRRVATRDEKTGRNFLAFWQFASIMIRLL